MWTHVITHSEDEEEKELFPLFKRSNSPVESYRLKAFEHFDRGNFKDIDTFISLTKIPDVFCGDIQHQSQKQKRVFTQFRALVLRYWTKGIEDNFFLYPFFFDRQKFETFLEYVH
jgi:hypothetical protein